MKQTWFIFVLALSCSLVYSQQAQAPVQASSAPGPQTTSTTPPPRHTLLDGTPVKLRLSQSISSADAKVGQEVPFEVMEDVKVDDMIVLPKGATAIANVTEAEHKKSMGRAGKVNVAITYARLDDNEKVALRAVKEAKGGGHVGAMTGAIVATSIVFFPAAPLFLFVHGKDITIPQGTEITAFVDGDMHLDMTHFGATFSTTSVAVAPQAAPPAQASLSVVSTPAGADVEVDGNFVGNTPSTLSLTPGSHQIAVKKKGFVDWTKTLTITGGNINLNAELQEAAGQ
ncbi:MAG TPA: PEGA domain-containing protein [Terracidiphilus sp.]|jgi:hypothetical protein